MSNSAIQERPATLAEKVLQEGLAALTAAEPVMRDAARERPYAGVGTLLAGRVALWHDHVGGVYIDLPHNYRVRMLPGWGHRRSRIELRAGTAASPRPIEGIDPRTAADLLATLQRYARYKDWNLPKRADLATWQRAAGTLESVGRAIETWLERQREPGATRDEAITALFRTVRRTTGSSSCTARIRADLTTRSGDIEAQRLYVSVRSINEWNHHHLRWNGPTVSNDADTLDLDMNLGPDDGADGRPLTAPQASPEAQTVFAFNEARNERYRTDGGNLRYRTSAAWRALLQAVRKADAWKALRVGEEGERSDTHLWHDLAEEPTHAIG